MQGFAPIGRGETILAQAGRISFLGHVVSGVLRLQKTLRDGRQQIVACCSPAMCSDGFSCLSHTAIEAATDVTICCYDRVIFESLLVRFPELEHRMLAAIARELDAAQNWMTLLAMHTVSGRVSTFMLLLQKQALPASVHEGGITIVDIPICRRDMAAYLGTTVESISRSLQHMVRSGGIRVLSPQRFEIVDRGRLIALSNHDAQEFVLSSARPRRLD